MAASGALDAEAALDGGLLQPPGVFTVPAGGHWLTARARDPLGHGKGVSWLRVVASGAPAARVAIGQGLFRWPFAFQSRELSPDLTVTVASWPAETPEPGEVWTLQAGDEIQVISTGLGSTAEIDGIPMGPAPLLDIRALAPGRHSLRLRGASLDAAWPLEVVAAGGAR